MKRLLGLLAALFLCAPALAVQPAPAGSSKHAQTGAVASNLVVSGDPASLFSLNVTADSTLYAADWFVMVFDLGALPADGAVTPAKCYQVAAGQPAFGATYGEQPPYFATAITVGVSTTGCYTLTKSAHAHIAGDYR